MIQIIRNNENLPRSPRVHELLDHLELDDSIHGYMDWVTGLMQVNCDVDDYLKAKATGNVPGDLATAVLHESYHALQLAMLGYLYRFAITLHTIIQNSLPENVNSYDEIFDSIPQKISHSELYQNIVRDLHRKVNGISVIDIVESLTYCAQNREACGYDTDRYAEFLRKSHVAAEYSSAFMFFLDQAATSCDVVKAFPVVAHLSLCSHSPPECFEILVEAYRKSRLSLSTNLPDIIEFCRINDKDYRGFSWEFRDALGNSFPKHPHFETIRDFFFDHPQGSELFSKFVLLPELLGAEAQVEAAVDVVIFKPRPDPSDPQFREWPALTFKKNSLLTPERLARVGGQKLMVAISRRLMGTVSIPL